MADITEHLSIALADRYRIDEGRAFISGSQALARLPYEQLRADRDTFTSIVLMTDGENTAGAKARDFDTFYAGLGREARDIPVFPILFGDSDRSELAHIADLTGGRLFDAQQGSLDGAFEEIRGYQ
jgi:Ca-activated chloride channel family protein